MSSVPTHITNQLIDDCDTIGTAFMLITKSSEANAPLSIIHSSHFLEHQRTRVYSVLKDSKEFTSIAIIKPAIKNTTILQINRLDCRDLIQHYTNLFTCLSQVVCKEIGKQWIKVAEPKKQGLYPYKSFNNSKPQWWPANVNHIEPDHLDKDGRIVVLISILRNPKFSLDSMKLKCGMVQMESLVLTSLLDEIFYVAFYDRLFYSSNKVSNPYYEHFSVENTKLLSSNSLLLKVSRVLSLRLSQISLSDLNSTVFGLNGSSLSNSNDPEPDLTAEPKQKKRREQGQRASLRVLPGLILPTPHKLSLPIPPNSAPVPPQQEIEIAAATNVRHVPERILRKRRPNLTIATPRIRPTRLLVVESIKTLPSFDTLLEGAIKLEIEDDSVILLPPLLNIGNRRSSSSGSDDSSVASDGPDFMPYDQTMPSSLDNEPTLDDSILVSTTEQVQNENYLEQPIGEIVQAYGQQHLQIPNHPLILFSPQSDIAEIPDLHDYVPNDQVYYMVDQYTSDSSQPLTSEFYEDILDR